MWRNMNVFDMTEEVCQTYLIPPHHYTNTNANMLSQHPPRSDASQPTKTVHVNLHEKNKNKENVHSLSALEHNVFSPYDEHLLKNSTSAPLLDQSYSDDSLYAKVMDVSQPEENTASHRPRLHHSQESLTHIFQGRSPSRDTEESPFMHKSNNFQPTPMAMEHISYDRTQIPHSTMSYNQKPKFVIPMSGSREVLHEKSQTPHSILGSSEVMKHGSREALDQPTPRSYHLSRSREPLHQVIPPQPHHLLKSSENYNNDIRIKSFLSKSGEILTDPPRFQVSRPQVAPSIESCSTHYQPTDAALHQTQTQTAYRIAPYDDPIIPPKPSPLKLPKRQGKDAFQSTKAQPVLPPQREDQKPFKKTSKAHFRDMLQKPGLSLSMDTLDAATDTHHRPSKGNIWPSHQHPHPLPTTKSLNNLLDDSSSSLRSYGKPTLL